MAAQMLGGPGGLLNLQGLSESQPAGLIQRLRHMKPGQAGALTAQYLAAAPGQRVSQAASYRRAGAQAARVTPPRSSSG